MEILEAKRITYEEYKNVKQQLKKLQEMENCLSDYAVFCVELFRIQKDENTDILYWIRIIAHTDDSDYEIEILKEEQSVW